MSKRIIKGSPTQNRDCAEIQSKVKSRIIPQGMVKITKADGIHVNHQVPVASKHHHSKSDAVSSKSISDHHRTIPTTALGVSQLVEAKVREFEERFQFEKEQALTQGIAQGEARGVKEGLKGVERIEKLFDKVLNEFRKEKEHFYNEAETGVARLALEIAEAIIGEAASKVSDDILNHNLKRCLESLKSSGKIKIRISPVDYDFARTNTQLIQKASGDGCSLEFEPDPSIAPGGCYLETMSGAIDGRLESQFDIIKDNFLQIA